MNRSQEDFIEIKNLGTFEENTENVIRVAKKYLKRNELSPSEKFSSSPKSSVPTLKFENLAE
jgi:hypothetical protein